MRGRDSRCAGIAGLPFAKVIALVMRSGNIAAHFEPTISSTSLAMNVPNRTLIMALASTFHPQCVIISHWRRLTWRIGSSTTYVTFLQHHGEAMAKIITLLLRAVRASSGLLIAAWAPRRNS